VIFRPPLRGRTQLGAARGHAAFFAQALQFFGALDVAAVFFLIGTWQLFWSAAGQKLVKHRGSMHTNKTLHGICIVLLACGIIRFISRIVNYLLDNILIV